jgi:MFS family permease
MNGVNVAVGYSLASYMGMAFFYAKEPALQWRGPLGIALVWPVLTLVILMFVPESPRWLLMKGRVDEARDVILKLHTSKDDPEQKFAQEEFHQMQAQSNLEKTLDSSWRALFQRRSYRKRLLIASGFGFIGQSTAVLVINNYGPTIYKSLGFDTKDQLALQCGSNTTAAVFNFLGAAVMDRFGRRPLILISLLGCAVALTIETAMVALYAEAGTNKAGLSAGVFALYLFPAVYAMGIDVAGYTFFSEVNCENLLPTVSAANTTDSCSRIISGQKVSAWSLP